MAQIFLSYRRSDSQYATRSISDRLQQSLGKEALFQDVKSVSLGEDFEKRVNNILETCEVMLVIMGDEWLTVEDEEGGGRRLDNPDDLVRREVAAALVNESTVVIPVLTGDAEMPKPDDLPDDLKALATRNAAVVRADASFDSQMDALITEIERQVPALRPVVRYGKLGLMGVAAVAVLGIAWAIYASTRAPDDLSSLNWSEEYVVNDLDFGETKYQALLLRTSEDAPVITGGEAKKYEMMIDVEDEVDHEHEYGEDEEFDHASQHTNLVTASLIYWEDLPEDHPAYFNIKDVPFVKFEAGTRYGTAQVKVSYFNKDGGAKTTSVQEVHILAPRIIEKEATEELDRIVATAQDLELSDQEILAQADNMLNGDEIVFTLENGTGLTYNDVLSQDQRDILAGRIAKAQAAVAALEKAEGMSASLASLADRRQAWNDYKAASQALGRPPESPQAAAADNAVASIDDFADSEMNVNGASACTDIGGADGKDCVGPKTCLSAGEPIRSWARLLVSDATANIKHRLVNQEGGIVVQSDPTQVRRNRGLGYRSNKTLRVNGESGKFALQVIFGDTVISSVNVCIDDCSECS